MQTDFQTCIKIIKNFYSKVTKDHPRAVRLTNELNSMIEQIQSQNHLNTFNLRTNPRMSDLSQSARSHSRKSKTTKKNIKNEKYESLFTHQNFGAVLAFAYIHHIVTIEDTEKLKIIDTKAKLLYGNDTQQKEKQNDKDKERVKMQHSMMEWKKVMNLIGNKKTVKWQKVLTNAFQSFQVRFIEIILYSILSLSSSFKFEMQVSKKFLQKVSDILRISIILYQIQQDKIKQKIKMGTRTHCIILGQNKQSQKTMYLCFDKPLEKDGLESEKYLEQNFGTQSQSNLVHVFSQQQIQTEQSTKTDHAKGLKSYKSIESSPKLRPQSMKKRNSSANAKLAARKSLITVQFLLKQYYLNSLKFSSLECLSQNEEPKIQKKGSQTRMSLKSTYSP